MDLGQVFNKQELPEAQGFDPIPAGDYRVQIAAAEVKQTKAGTGSYMSIRYDVLGPTHQGRVIFDTINVRNPSQAAEEIGRQQIGSLMGAIGLQTLRDTDQLIGSVCIVKVKIERDEQYGDKNRIKSWKAIEGAQLPQPQMPQMQQPAQQPTQQTSAMPGAAPAAAPAAGKPPWA